MDATQTVGCRSKHLNISRSNHKELSEVYRGSHSEEATYNIGPRHRYKLNLPVDINQREFLFPHSYSSTGIL